MPGRRPSSVLAGNVVSLSTADMEMQADASRNPRVREPVLHLVLSLHPGIDRPDEDLLAGVVDVLQRLHLGHHRYLIAVHRDTDHLHAHAMVSTVDPRTFRAYPQRLLYKKIAGALRRTELAMGWEHDRGLSVVAENGDVEEPSLRDRLAWRRARQAQAQDRKPTLTATAKDRLRYEIEMDSARATRGRLLRQVADKAQAERRKLREDKMLSLRDRLARHREISATWRSEAHEIVATHQMPSLQHWLQERRQPTPAVEHEQKPQQVLEHEHRPRQVQERKHKVEIDLDL